MNRRIPVALLLLLLLSATPAAARNPGTGLGIIIGEPTGISAKLWLGDNTAFDAAAAWSLYRYAAFHVHADFLYHSFELLDVSPGALPAYIGIGGRFKLAGRRGDLEHDTRIGVRVPLGLEYLFEPVPVGLFIEAAPVLDLVPGTGFSVNGAIGARWYFR